MRRAALPRLQASYCRTYYASPAIMRVPRRPCTSGSRGVDRWSASPSRQADTCISVVRGSVTASLHVVRLRVMRHRGGTSTGGRSETPTRTVRPESRPGAHAPEGNETCRQTTPWHLMTLRSLLASQFAPRATNRTASTVSRPARVSRSRFASSAACGTTDAHDSLLTHHLRLTAGFYGRTYRTAGS